MKKQLKEEVSRIKNMMKKINEGEFEDNKPVNDETKNFIMDLVNKIKENFESGKNDVDQIDSENSYYGGMIIYSVCMDENTCYDLEYDYEIEMGEAPYEDEGDRWTPPYGSEGEWYVKPYQLKVSKYENDIKNEIYSGEDFTDLLKFLPDDKLDEIHNNAYESYVNQPRDFDPF